MSKELLSKLQASMTETQKCAQDRIEEARFGARINKTEAEKAQDRIEEARFGALANKTETEKAQEQIEETWGNTNWSINNIHLETDASLPVKLATVKLHWAEVKKRTRLNQHEAQAFTPEDTSTQLQYRIREKLIDVDKNANIISPALLETADYALANPSKLSILNFSSLGVTKRLAGKRSTPLIIADTSIERK